MSLISQLQNIPIYNTKVDLQLLNDKEETVTVPVDVYYRARTTKEARETQTLVKEKTDKGEMVFISDLLIRRVTKIVEADGTETEVTQELLDSMDVKNLQAIESAIDEASTNNQKQK